MPEVLVALTGGGTAGHVMPHFAILPQIYAKGWRVVYVGSNGIEKGLVEKAGIEFKTVSAGKLRRYFSVKNLMDIGRVALGFLQSLLFFLRRRPQVLFSKGGFVSVPVSLAAWCLKIPVISHESDLTPGLANRIIAKFASRILYTFPDTGKYLPAKIAMHVGTPVREELFQGQKARGESLCGFDSGDSSPVILVMGGSQGAQKINDSLLAILPEILKTHRVIHLTGKGKSIVFSHSRYRAFEFVTDDLKDLLALADFVVSRAGANAIFEFLELTKPMLLIPLEQGSRGDQILNAESFVRSGWALTLSEGALTPARFLQGLAQLFAKKNEIELAQKKYSSRSSAKQIVEIMESLIT